MKMKEIMTTLNAHAKIRSLVDEEKKRPGLLILPGGGFFTLSAKEGMRIAEEFSKRKYNCFVLSYSTVNNNRKYCCWDAAYDDLINAIELLKKNRNKYCIDNHLFLMGFSAGGNLAATYGNDHGDDCDGIVLGYPAVDFEMIFEKLDRSRLPQAMAFQHLIKKGLFHGTKEDCRRISPLYSINENSTDTFVWGTQEDEIIDTKSLKEYMRKMIQKGRNCELHLFENGKHGSGLAQNLEDTKAWVEMADEWMKRKIGQ